MNLPVGSIGWMDLTVPDAAPVLDFYRQVVGWSSSEVPVGDYVDFCVHAPESGDVVAGICHARGPNAGLPPAWLVYITVADLDASLERCLALGGSLVSGPRGAGGQGRYCVVRDPAGAAFALFSAPPPGDPAA